MVIVKVVVVVLVALSPSLSSLLMPAVVVVVLSVIVFLAIMIPGIRGFRMLPERDSTMNAMVGSRT